MNIAQLSTLTNLIATLLATYKSEESDFEGVLTLIYEGDYYNLIIDTIENKMDNNPDAITDDERLFLTFTK